MLHSPEHPLLNLSSHWAVRNIAGASALWCCTFELLHTFNYECTADFESLGDYFVFRGQNIQWGISRDLLFSGQFRGPKGSWPPRKIPNYAPFFVLPQTKKNNLNVQNQRYIGIFMSLRETERESERERERERESERERERKRKRTKVWVIIFLNRTGLNEKSANYI
jgi:hypothetical protein